MRGALAAQTKNDNSLKSVKIDATVAPFFAIFC